MFGMRPFILTCTKPERDFRDLTSYGMLSKNRMLPGSGCSTKKYTALTSRVTLSHLRLKSAFFSNQQDLFQVLTSVASDSFGAANSLEASFVDGLAR